MGCVGDAWVVRVRGEGGNVWVCGDGWCIHICVVGVLGVGTTVKGSHDDSGGTCKCLPPWIGQPLSPDPRTNIPIDHHLPFGQTTVQASPCRLRGSLMSVERLLVAEERLVAVNLTRG